MRNRFAAVGVSPDVIGVFARHESASEALTGWGRGRRCVGMTMGQFSMIDLIRAVLDYTGPAALRLSTWTAGIRDANNAAFLLDDGLLTSVQLLVDRSFPVRQPAYCGAVQRLFGDDAIRCTNTHAKIALVSNDEWNVAIRSSMNLNRNPRFENFDIDDNEAVAAVFHAHFDEMQEQQRPGIVSSRTEVDAVFRKVRAGLNPFDESEAPPVVKRPELRAWVLASMAQARKTRQGLRTLPAIAKRCGWLPGDLVRTLDNPTEQDCATVVAVVWKANGGK